MSAPAAAPAHFPYVHRTMADILAAAAAAAAAPMPPVSHVPRRIVHTPGAGWSWAA